MDERMYKLQSLVDKGIDEIIAKPALDKEAVCIAGELIDIKKDMEEIRAMEEYGYSEMRSYGNGNSYASGRRGGSYNSYGHSYDNGNGWGNSHNGMYNRGYSRGNGRDEMIAHLEQAMNNATTEQERESIRRMIVQYENG